MITKDGFLNLSSMSVIGPKLLETSFLNSALSSTAPLDSGNDGWTRYRGKALLDNGQECSFTLFFDRGVLKRVSWRPKWPGAPTSWKDWTEEGELKVNELNNQLLLQVLGPPPYEYEWGRISSSYDPRSGSSNIVVAYD